MGLIPAGEVPAIKVAVHPTVTSVSEGKFPADSINVVTIDQNGLDFPDPKLQLRVHFAHIILRFDVRVWRTGIYAKNNAI